MLAALGNIYKSVLIRVGHLCSCYQSCLVLSPIQPTWRTQPLLSRLGTRAFSSLFGLARCGRLAGPTLGHGLGCYAHLLIFGTSRMPPYIGFLV